MNELTCALGQVGKQFIRSGAIRTMAVIGLVAGLAGCSISRQIEQNEAAPTALNLNDALADCRNGYPDQITQAVARAACVIKAMEQLRPLLPFPELLDRENVARKSLAEQVQNGSITLVERNRQITKLHANIVAEEQSRWKEKPGEAGAASLAVTQWRLSNSDGCMSLGGNTANCY
jgi:hypothetical protein